MATTSSAELDAMELEAVSYFSLHQYNEAEQVYRRIWQAQMEAKGPDEARREQYNLASVLVKEEKFDEAEPLLREVLGFLEARSNRNRKHFMQQEAGTMRLLVQTLGEEKTEPRTLSRNSHCEVEESHPVDSLLQVANETWSTVINRRTDEIKDGAAAYRARRGRHPPPWFDRWYKNAQSQHVIIVEDFFDQIYRDLEPFWAIDPASIRASLEGWQDVAKVRNGRVTEVPQGRFRTRVWGDMLRKISSELPDLDIALNGLDEPRVLAPWEAINQRMVAADAQKKTMRSLPASSFAQGYPAMVQSEESSSPKPKWITRHDQFKKGLRNSCAPDSPLRKEAESNPHLLRDAFVQNVTASSDICQNPNLLSQHGFLIEPASVNFATSLVPIFSAAKLGVNNDILLPEPAYYSDNKLFSGKDWRGDWSSYFPWGSKIHGLIWRGAATGGHARTDTWKQFHRHRFVSRLNASNVDAENANEGTMAPFKGQEPLQGWLTRMVDVGLSRILCNGPQGEKICPILHQNYKTAPSIKMGQQYKWKYLADIDGNTLSGRFRAFMRSNSAVMKTTIFMEWHDARLFAWKHYIPLDISFDGIYDVMAYFLGMGNKCDHDAAGERIANDGQKWANAVLRKEDMLVYMHRALLEYARIVHDDRDHLGYVQDLLEAEKT
ncbi:hypothetical protein PRZ48_009681 [Zasmidium cellare]|uniref:Glycosyl transferase CAP10 domain-containing protein n=1 Tax=Zasmidium cellare TaxID=395010 RepID=A0ABR0ECS7_ZASCE|nr:hypothetical protein PRZ48_009681 [Zasmidium cellare]